MERIPRGVYSSEFREQAVKLVEVEGLGASKNRRFQPTPPHNDDHGCPYRFKTDQVYRLNFDQGR